MNETGRSGGDLVVEALVGAGVDTIFGLPGVQLDAIFDALARRPGEIRVIHTRHEQATSYMADGYARATGRIGCCLVVPGPGLLNAMSGLATAYSCSSPVLCIAGQIRSDAIDAGEGLLHEIPNQLEMVRSVVKWSGRAMHAQEVPALMAEAFRQLAAGRPRPVEVEIPPDVLEAVTSAAPASAGLADEKPDTSDAVEEAASLIRAARRPLIAAGGGAIQSGAGDLVRGLAERLGAPVLMSPQGKGIISARHPLAFEWAAAPALLPAADLVIAVGTRFVNPQGGRRRLATGQSLIRIDADGGELAADGRVGVGIESDAREALGNLLQLLGDGAPVREWEGLAEIRAAVAARIGAVQPQAAYGLVIREELPEDGILVNGMTQVGYWGRIGFPVYEPRTFIGPGYQGTLGFELPTGLGAQAGMPDRKVVVIAGDGGFMFNVQELATAAQHRLNTVTVLFNDGGYGNVRRIQNERFQGRQIASDLQNPDFVKLADAFGIEGARVADPAGLRHELRRALSAGRPALIEVQVKAMDSPWPLLFGSASA